MFGRVSVHYLVYLANKTCIQWSNNILAFSYKGILISFDLFS